MLKWSSVFVSAIAVVSEFVVLLMALVDNIVRLGVAR